METLQTDVNGFNNRSLQFVGNFRGVLKAPNSGDANCGHLQIADTRISAKPYMKTSE